MNKVINGLHPAELRDHLDRLMYCGRYALIAATGATSEQVTTAINLARNEHHDKHVGSTSVGDIVDALETLGYTVSSERLYWRNTHTSFAQWRKREQHSRTATYVVLITGHWITVRGDWITDTKHADPVDMSRKNPYARKRVQAVIKITGA